MDDEWSPVVLTNALKSASSEITSVKEKLKSIKDEFGEDSNEYIVACDVVRLFGFEI